MDMGAGMMKSLASRRKNKMGALKYKMQAAAYGGDAESWIGIFDHYDSDGSGELDFDEVSAHAICAVACAIVGLF